MSDPDQTGPVGVFRTNDPGLLALAQSLLTSAQIEHVVAGEGLQSLFPIGHYGSDFTAEIQVPAEDADEARELLSELGQVRPEWQP